MIAGHKVRLQLFFLSQVSNNITVQMKIESAKANTIGNGTLTAGMGHMQLSH